MKDEDRFCRAFKTMASDVLRRQDNSPDIDLFRKIQTAAPNVLFDALFQS